MSKQLPYYQFEVAEYLAGEIMLCSLEAQGLFSIIKCLYWQRDCDLNVSKVLKRHNRQDLIEELVDERCIKLDQSGNITITFLHEQHHVLTERRSKLSKAGRKGGKRKTEATLKQGLSEVKATLKPPLSEVKATFKHIEEKRREKKKEVDSVPIKKLATSSKMDLFLEMYNEVRKSKLKKARVVKTWTDKAKRNFAKVLTKEYTKNQIKGAIVAAFEDKHHIDTIYQYLTVEFLTREDILERYVMAHDAGNHTTRTPLGIGQAIGG